MSGNNKGTVWSLLLVIILLLVAWGFTMNEKHKLEIECDPIIHQNEIYNTCTIGCFEYRRIELGLPEETRQINQSIDVTIMNQCVNWCVSEYYSLDNYEGLV